jgi:NADPH:quinone reductase-like Zn-dependent oxidoreductase
MSATVVATDYGGPEVLRFVDEEVGPPGPGQVVLDVRAAGTNPVDYKRYSGAYGRDPAQLPIRLGMEAAGVVAETADGVLGPAGPVHLGDEVIAYRIEGAYATRVVVPASSLVPKPSVLSFEEAGGLMLTGATAVHLVSATGVGPGDTVVIHGASGGVGLMAVQIAVVRGARVIGTAGEGMHEYLRQLGAEPVTYGDGLTARIRELAPDGVDAAIDTVGTEEAIDSSIALVSDRSRIATIAAFQRGFALGIKVLGGAPGADPGDEIRSAARLELVHLVEKGRLRVRVEHAYPLAEVAEAHRELAKGHTHGKIVLVP